MTKVSILCFYLRIFPNPYFRHTTYAVMAWVVASGIVFLFLQIFQCLPLNFIWEGWISDGLNESRCLNVNLLAYVAGAFSIAQDIVVLALPIPLLVKLNVSIRSRVEVILMFSLGIFVLITSCIRMRYMIMFAKTSNPTWDYSEPLLWSGLEVAVSIIVVSLPAVRVLVTRTVPCLTGRKRNSHDSPNPGAFIGGMVRVSNQKHSLGPHSSTGNEEILGGYKKHSAQSRLFAALSGSIGRDSTDSQLELGNRNDVTVRTEITSG